MMNICFENIAGRSPQFKLPINIQEWIDKEARKYKRRKLNCQEHNTKTSSNHYSQSSSFYVCEPVHIIYVNNVDNSESFAPILPPDKICKNGFDMNYDNPDKARSNYQPLLKHIKNQRKYVPSCYHVNLFKNSIPELIDWNQL